MLKTGFESELRTGKVTECVTLMDRDYKVRKEDGGPLGNTTEGKGKVGGNSESERAKNFTLDYWHFWWWWFSH